MNTRNKFGYMDWHIAVILLNISWTYETNYCPNWIYFLQVTTDDSDGRSLFSYIKLCEGKGCFTTYLNIFWIDLNIESGPECKYPWLLSNTKLIQVLCDYLWNRWVHKEHWSE